MGRMQLAAWAAAAGLGCAVSAQAAVLAEYGFGTEDVDKHVTPDVQNGVTATPITWPTGIPAAPARTEGWEVNGTNPSGGNVFSFSTYGKAPSLTEAYTNGVYFSFTLTANSGTLDLGQLEFDVTKGWNGGATPSYGVNSSVDGWTYDSRLISGLVTAEPPVDPAGTIAFNHVTVDLSAPKFDNLSTITFRVFWDDQWSGPGSFDAIRVSAPIPEPASLGLLGLGGLLALRRRR